MVVPSSLSRERGTAFIAYEILFFGTNRKKRRKLQIDFIVDVAKLSMPNGEASVVLKSVELVELGRTDDVVPMKTF